MSISINTPANVTSIELSNLLGAKIGGTMSLSGFTNCTTVKVQGNALTNIDFDFSNNQYEIIRTRLNSCTGAPASISNQSSLTTYDISNNAYTGTISSPPTNIVTYDISDNNLVGSDPDISNCANLTHFYIHNNTFSAVGSPDISNNPNLQFVQFNNNNFTGGLANLNGLTGLKEFNAATNEFIGNIPEISGATGLEKMYCNNNNFTGSIPDLNDNSALTILNCSYNDLTGWAGTAFPATFKILYANGNDLSSDTVDAILGALVTAGATNGIVNVGGTNATAGSAGVTAKNTLISRSWSVTVNV